MNAPLDVVHELYRLAFLQSKADEEKQRQEEEKQKAPKSKNSTASPNIDIGSAEDLIDILEEGG